MVAGIFHTGSGIGNQLFRYITTRVLALDKGYDWGMVNSQEFKGKTFMNLDMGYDMFPLPEKLYQFEEKKIVENGIDVRGYDPEINFIQDNTIIDGEFQDERYWGHHLPIIREWLKVEPLEMPDDVCVINFRGGEFSFFPDMFLTKEYWDEAIKLMKEKYPNIKFEVHTDDYALAKQFFPNFKVIETQVIGHSLNTNMGLNWRAIRYAKHLILSNSSFAILPALLNEDVKEVIAPRFWGRRNLGIWSMPQNYYKKFQYI